MAKAKDAYCYTPSEKSHPDKNNPSEKYMWYFSWICFFRVTLSPFSGILTFSIIVILLNCRYPGC